jgi:hypothetical protein
LARGEDALDAALALQPQPFRGGRWRRIANRGGRFNLIARSVLIVLGVLVARLHEVCLPAVLWDLSAAALRQEMERRTSGPAQGVRTGYHTIDQYSIYY